MINRRELLSGIAGGVVSAGLIKAVEISHANIISVSNIMMLRKITAPEDRLCVVVLGYHFAGDGGAKLVYWDSASQKPANQGTVISALLGDKGRWIQLHDGVVDFRQFGIFNGQDPADLALEAMVNDPLIHRIEAHTALNFCSRHRFTRSNLTLDFGGHTITTAGLEPLTEPKNNYISAIFSFRGEFEEQTTVTVLNTPLNLLAEIYPVGNSNQFPVGQWFCLESEKLSGQWERKIQRLVQVTEVIDDSHVRLNYRCGWSLDAGTSLHWRKVIPVEYVTIKNMAFIAEGQLPDTSSQPVVFEYAIYCDVFNLHAQGTFWSVIFRRWNTFFRTEQCSLSDPPSVSWGGAGYLTQQIYCQYGHIANCTTSNARHLNDLTASSSCVVVNCHSNGDSTGGFVTHGQYEHDLHFSGNSGTLTLANSGKNWGQSAARIVINQHFCSVFIADTKVSDLTLTDVHIERDPEQGNIGMLRLNCDGVTVRGCTVNGELTLFQRSNRSTKMNFFEGCGFTLDSRHDSTNSHLAADDPYIASHPYPASRNSLSGHSVIHFVRCWFRGTDAQASLLIKNKETYFNACQIDDVSLVLAAEDAQTLVINGDSSLKGGNSSSPLISRAGSQPVTWLLGPMRSEVRDSERMHIHLTDGINYYQARNANFIQGRRQFSTEAFNTPSYFIEHDNIMINVKSVVPEKTGPHIMVRNTEL